MKKNSLSYRIRNKIARSRARVFVMSDFANFPDYDQNLRVLRQMVQSGELIKLGQGIYARAKRTSDGSVVPMDAVVDLVPLALSKLGIKPLPSRASLDYNYGQSTQVPTGRVIGVNKRVRRNISYNGRAFRFETIGKRIAS